MKLIAVDLELTQPNRKIIQIGAVCFNPVTGEMYDTFNKFVNPKESISAEITKLTGIEQYNVLLESDIIESANLFSLYKNHHKASPIAVVWGAGKSNDVRHIYDESSVESPFKDKIIDVKATYGMFANTQSNSFRAKRGLNGALESLGLGWDYKCGKQHNALADAYNTMRIYMFLSKCLKGGIELKLS